MEEALGRRCVADVSFLNNFVHSESAHVLERILGGPVHLPPTVLDVHETLLPDFPGVECFSQFLRPLSMFRLPKYSSYRTIAPLIQSFALAVGTLWQPVELTRDELVLAARLGSKRIRAEKQDTRPRANRRKMELGCGEAEAAAIAINRGWTLLTEDQAAVELLRYLYPEVPVQGACSLLVHAAEQGIIACSEAADLFNRRIVNNLRFWAFRMSGGKQERLWLRCNPTSCSWEPDPH